MHTNENRQVLVAMSGGVDSSVCALLLRQAGYEPYGATLSLYDAALLGLEAGGCGAADAVADARRVAQKLEIPFTVYEEKQVFRQAVMEDFCREYCAGRTPNPCIRCNRHVKFQTLLEHARQRGIPRIATGHYARVAQDPQSGRWLLLRGKERKKDQSYVLYQLTQSQLSRLLLPVGEYDKPSVRALAEQAGLHNAQKKDSQDICFIPDGDYLGFLRRWANVDPANGDFVDTQGQVLGRHKGQMAYTLGQRKGLGISSSTALYVLGKDLDANTVILGEEKDLYHRTLLADNFNWIALPALTAPLRCSAKSRYSQQEAEATVYPPDGTDCHRVVFDQPQRALTPGQAVVLYEGERVLGGGTIRQIAD